MSTLTTRNQLRDKITGVTLGEVIAEVEVDVWRGPRRPVPVFGFLSGAPRMGVAYRE